MIGAVQGTSRAWTMLCEHPREQRKVPYHAFTLICIFKCGIQHTVLCLQSVTFHLKTTTVVTTTELSPPPRWLATTEPTPPCFTVFSLVFVGAVSSLPQLRAVIVI